MLNIVYFHSHDTGRYIQPYGYRVSTPHLQLLAEEGVVFRQVYCASPSCSPSRAALLTGGVPHQTGMFGLAHRGFRLHDYSKTLIRVLNDAGYESILCGFQHITERAAVADIGYHHTPPAGYDPTVRNAVDNALEFLRYRDQSKPFFMDVGTFETHRYMSGPASCGAHFADGPRGDGRYVRGPEPLPDTPEVRADWADFQESAAELDRGVGRLYHALAEQGLLDDTLFVYTTDHGPAFPLMKCNLTDFGIQVAMVMRGPGPLRGGKVIDGMIEQLDVLPTFCELLGVQTPAWVRGTSFLPLLRGEGSGKREIFSEINHHAAFNPQRCIRTERHKLIKVWPGAKDTFEICCDPGPSKDLLTAAGWPDAQPPPVQLYDLLMDPNETNNLADHPACATIVDDLSARLDRWMHDTDDPLLQGVEKIAAMYRPKPAAF